MVKNTNVNININRAQIGCVRKVQTHG